MTMAPISSSSLAHRFPLNAPHSFIFSIVVLVLTTPLRMACSYEVPSQVREATATVKLSESGGMILKAATPTQRDATGKILTEWIQRDWRMVFDNLNAVFPARREQAIAIELAETLPPRTYVEFVNLVLDRLPTGTINEDIVESVLIGSSVKHGFLAYNYDHPDVQAIYHRALEVLPPNARCREFLVRGMAGDLRRQAIMSRESRSLPLPEELAKAVDSPLPKSEASEASTPWTFHQQTAQRRTTNGFTHPTRSKTLFLCVLGLIMLGGCVAWLYMRQRRRKGTPITKL